MSFKGFTLIEVLVTAFVLATVTVAVTGLGLLSTRSAIQNERQNVAQAIANEEIETARTYRYEEIEYTDVSPEGKVERDKTVKRNDQDYLAQAFIDYIDDPKNGSLPPDTPVTAQNADFKKLLVKISWASNISGQSQSSTSSTVVAATFFANKADDACVPGTITCENPSPDCIPGTPAGCADASGQLTLDCPASGVCPGSATEPFVACPASGKCEDSDKPTPASNPNPEPSSEPEWCQEIGLGGGTAEVCSLEGCNDFQDNDGDGGIDVNGRDNDGNGRFDDQVDTPLDEQCAAMANEGGLFVWESCIRNKPYSATDCSGLQRGREIAPTTSQCTLLKSCGTRRLLWRSCEVPQCQPEPNRCEKRHECPEFSTCLGGQLGQTKPSCPFNQPKCANGLCFECVKAPDGSGVSECNNVAQNDPERGAGDPNWCTKKGAQGCSCKSGKCVQCTSIDSSTKDSTECRNDNFPYCSSGRCVECNHDSQCSLKYGVEKPYCRTAKSPADKRNTCQDECNDGKDNDGDGKADSDDVDCIFGSEKSHCSDGLDNDDDGKVDFGPNLGNDPGCITPDDPDEDDPSPQCNDGLDNDDPEDLDVDLNDIGCSSPQDNNEANPTPAPQPSGSPSSNPFPPLPL